MDIVTTKTILDQIDKSSLVGLRNDLFKCGVRYARIRSDWWLSTLDDRKDMDVARTMAHNTFIDACNILSRNMAKAGEDNHWREKLGEDRKVIGDFACYLHCILGLRSR